MRKSVVIFTLFALLAMFAMAQADVIVKQEAKSSAMGMMEMEIKTVEYVRADMSASEQTTLAKGGMAVMFGGADKEIKNVMVNRLDKGVMWDINIDEKSYFETRLDSYKEMIGGDDEDAYTDEDEIDEEDDYEWTVDIQTKDKPVDINGFSCKGYIATAKGVSKKDPNEKSELYFEYWYSNDVEGYDELKEYGENFAKITGVDLVESQKETGKVFSQYGDEFSKIFEKMGDADGYPIKTVVTVKGAGGDTPSMDEEEMDESKMPAGVMNMMKGMMGGKDKSEDGMATLFSVTNVVTSIEKKGVEDGKFEIPEGFEKESSRY